MRPEVELKSVVDDIEPRVRRLEAAGGRLVFRGRLEDRRFDTPDRRLLGRDEVLRVRVFRPGAGGAVRAVLEWKGATRLEGGYKVRDECSTPVGDAEALTAMLGSLGFVVTREIDRRVAAYELAGAAIRFEEYPRMDALVEVEGAPPAIEGAIAALGLARAGFTADRLTRFIERFEARTGTRAALSARELAGETHVESVDG